MAPLIVRDKVLVGNSGGELGVCGWLTAPDLGGGTIAWGGTVWGWISYDPDLDLVYYATANPGPWNAEQRPGDNKWTSGIFARRPDTGDAIRFYQLSPHDVHDYDVVNENVLLDLPIKGADAQGARPPRPQRLRRRDGPRDRRGAVGHAVRADHQLVRRRLDDRAAAVREDKEPKVGKAAWSPRTGFLYIRHQNLCMDEESTEANYIAGTPCVGMNVRMYAAPGRERGASTTWDPVGARAVWSLPEKFSRPPCTRARSARC